MVLGGRSSVRARFLKQHAPELAPGVAWRVLTNANVRRRVLAGLASMLKRVVGGGRDPAHQPPPDPAEPWTFLYFLATHPDFQGRGAGRALVAAFEQESVRRGCRLVRLTTGVGNAAAIALYRKSGWEEIARSGGLVHFERRLPMH